MVLFSSVRSPLCKLCCKSLTDMGGNRMFKTKHLAFMESPRGACALWPHFVCHLGGQCARYGKHYPSPRLQVKYRQRPHNLTSVSILVNLEVRFFRFRFERRYLLLYESFSFLKFERGGGASDLWFILVCRWMQLVVCTLRVSISLGSNTPMAAKHMTTCAVRWEYVSYMFYSKNK